MTAIVVAASPFGVWGRRQDMQMYESHVLRLCRHRAVLRAALALAPWVIFPARAQHQADDPTSAPPRPGDRLIFLAGFKKGEPARSGDLELGGPQAQVYPADPNGVLRNGTRLNLVILVRVGSDGVNEETRERSAEGVVAYSGVCTHQACSVNMWSKDRKALVCSFDLRSQERSRGFIRPGAAAVGRASA